MTAEEMQKEADEAEELQRDYNREIRTAEGDGKTHMRMGFYAATRNRSSWRQTAEICSRLDRIAEELERRGKPVEITTTDPPKNS